MRRNSCRCFLIGKRNKAYLHSPPASLRIHQHLTDPPSSIDGAALPRAMTVYFSFSNTLTNVPMCGRISTRNSSPSRSVTLGFFPSPTPAGVPVMMTVPAGRVVLCDRKLTSFGTLKMKSLHSGRDQPFWSIPSRLLTPSRSSWPSYSAPQSCRTTPFLRPRNLSLAGSGMRDLDTSVGPALHHSY